MRTTHAEKIQNGYLQQNKKRKYARQSDTESVSNEGEKNFSWTDEEMALLLQVTIAYKAEETSEGLDCDSVRSKYDGILEKFIERYPNNEATSEFPHSEDESVFTKDSLVARVKLCFRKAIDFSSKSN